ncbi:MAG: efflux RND transporter periplasmic adaptor subunit, partial [Schwartzia succinivorans]|nr:efflux RND transporter periplasmic adaptor subunit [Schwartzia succinivorans]
PISALKTNTGGSYVLVMQPDGSTKEQYIETGIYSDEYVEVLSGLNEGDVIVNSYKAKKSSSSGNSSGNRGGAPRGGRPPF